ncbi:MAG: hypothetical protein OEV64_03860 [Desulfobulbaceae bacterium]|nr:hypothetical protein [Desulfobulbaceae bacterium]
MAKVGRAVGYGLSISDVSVEEKVFQSLSVKERWFFLLIKKYGPIVVLEGIGSESLVNSFEDNG